MRLLRIAAIVASVSLGLCATGSRPADAEITDWDTSVVRLDLNERKFSDGFELYDDGETVLVPLLQTGNLLDAQVTLDPLLMTATVLRPWDGQTGLIDLKHQVCHWGGAEIAMLPNASLGPGDYFVPLHVVELLMDVRAVWQPEAQILLLNTDRPLSRLRAPVDPGARETSPRTDAFTEPEPVHMPAKVSLGSVQYVLRHGWASSDAEGSPEDLLDLSAYLQAGGIPVDIVVKGNDITSAHPVWDLKRIAATYMSPQLEVVAGDSAFSLGRSLKNAPIRGLRLATPPGWASGLLHAVTSVEGWVAPGSAVELSVNGAYFGKQTAADGHYAFYNIPLQIIRVNQLEVVIIDPNGQRTVEKRFLTATPRLLSVGQLQHAVGGGWVRSGKTGEWDSLVMGASTYAGVTSWLTIGGEIARQVILAGGEKAPPNLAGTVGMALRASDNLVFALDWLASRPEDAVTPLAQGAELTTNLQLGRTAWQSVIFYRQPGLRLFSRVPSDRQGYRVVAEYDISRAWDLQASYETFTVVSDPHAPQVVKMEGVVQWKPASDNSMLLRLQHAPNDRDKVVLAHHYTNPSKGTDLKSESSAEWLATPNAGPVLTNAGVKAELEKALSDTGYLGLRLSGAASWPLTGALEPQGWVELRDTVQVDGTWMPGQYQIGAQLEVTDRLSTRKDALPFTQGKVSLNASRLSGALVSGVATEVVQDRWNSNVDGAVTQSIYFGAKANPGLSGLIKLDYTHPLWSDAYKESIKATLRTDLRLRNGLHLGLVGQAKYRSLAPEWQGPEYYVGLTLSQGVGFSNGGTRGFQAVDGRPMGYIEGTVYIDANRNGKRDAGERAVAGVPVALAGRRAMTDVNGEYCFEFVNPGTYRLGLDPDKLPADFTVFTEPVTVRLPANANLSQDFGVTLNGTVDGLVFVDLNGDGLPQPGEPRPPWVKVVLDGQTEAFTDGNGNFSFGDVNLGKHQLSVPEANVPGGTRAPAPVDIEITEDSLDVWGVMLPLRLVL